MGFPISTQNGRSTGSQKRMPTWQGRPRRAPRTRLMVMPVPARGRVQPNLNQAWPMTMRALSRRNHSLAGGPGVPVSGAAAVCRATILPKRWEKGGELAGPVHGSGLLLGAVPQPHAPSQPRFFIDLAWLRRRGMLTPGPVSTLTWSRLGEQTGSITLAAQSEGRISAPALRAY